MYGNGVRFPVAEGGEWIEFRRAPHGGIVPVDDEPHSSFGGGEAFAEP